MNSMLKANDVWDWASDHYVLISKRNVYVKPMYKPKVTPKSRKKVEYNKREVARMDFKHVGTLSKGLSTSAALRQVIDAYGK